MDDLFGSLNTTNPTETTSNLLSTNTSDSLFSTTDPAAEFLANQQVELDKIESINTEETKKDNDWIVVNEEAKSTLNEQTSDQNKDLYAAIQQADKQSLESDKLKQWREEQKQRLLVKDAEEEKKKKELREQARKELDDWYQQRKEQLEKTHQNNKSNESEELKDVASFGKSTDGQEWERVSKLCDFNTKFNKNTKDVSRMRSILLQLKQQPLVR